MDYLLNILAGLIGVIAGAALSWLIGTRQSQVAATFKLHREYHGAAMNDSRERAGRIVHKHPEATYVNLWYMLDPADAQHIWNVMYYYQRLWLAIEYRNVHRKLVPDLFGESFYWWYSNSFAGQLLPVNDEAARDIGIPARLAYCSLKRGTKDELDSISFYMEAHGVWSVSNRCSFLSRNGINSSLNISNKL